MFQNKTIKRLRYLKYYAKILLNNWTINKDSYAQHGEDKLIELLLPGGVNTFIDIGANDGVLFSNTYKFAKLGAKGLCIEPSISAFRKLKLNHLLHRRIKCLQGAISNKPGHIFSRRMDTKKHYQRFTQSVLPDHLKCLHLPLIISSLNILNLLM